MMLTQLLQLLQQQQQQVQLVQIYTSKCDCADVSSQQVHPWLSRDDTARSQEVKRPCEQNASDLYLTACTVTIYSTPITIHVPITCSYQRNFVVAILSDYTVSFTRVCDAVFKQIKWWWWWWQKFRQIPKNGLHHGRSNKKVPTRIPTLTLMLDCYFKLPSG